MIPIQPIGYYHPTDSEGYLLQDADITKVALRWLPVLDIIRQTYQTELREDLHSLYLRGSVARGMEVDTFYDLDCFALLHREGYRWQAADFATELQQSLQAKFSFVHDVELMLSSFTPQLAHSHPRLAMIIKNQSICLAGAHLGPLLPRFKPQDAIGHNFRYLEEDAADFQAGKIDSRSMMKMLLRCGLEMVIERDGRYTNDIYLCYQTFSSYYPEQEPTMRRCLHYFLNPHDSPQKQRILVQTFVKWMQKTLIL